MVELSFIQVKCSRVQITLSIIALLIGGTIYIFFRSDNLILFDWLYSIGIKNILSDIRTDFLSYNRINIPNWAKYSLPDGLWIFSYMLLVNVINKEANDSMSKLIIYFLPSIAIIWEFAQALHYVPGMFDYLDLVFYLFFILLFNSFTHYKKVRI